MSKQQIKFLDVVVTRPFYLVEFDFVQQVNTGIKSREATKPGDTVKLESTFAREVVSSGKGLLAGTDDAKAFLEELKATTDAARAKAAADKKAATEAEKRASEAEQRIGDAEQRALEAEKRAAEAERRLAEATAAGSK